MKVRDLIKRLKKLDGNKEVVFYTSDSDYLYASGLDNCSDGLECIFGSETYDNTIEDIGKGEHLYLRKV